MGAFTFPDVLRACLDNLRFVAAFDRLMGCNLARRGTPIDLAVDDACDRTTTDMHTFVAFVYESVWTRLPQTERVDGELSPPIPWDAGAIADELQRRDE